MAILFFFCYFCESQKKIKKSIGAFNVFLGVMSKKAMIRDISHRFLGSRYFQQAGLGADGSSRISGHVLDVDAFGTSF